MDVTSCRREFMGNNQQQLAIGKKQYAISNKQQAN
jgi:hypothetical protein